MGSGFSRVIGTVWKRPLQRYNVEARAERELDRGKETAKRAPRFLSDEQLLSQLRENQPEQLKEVTKTKDSGLHSMLKQVYVTSTDPDDFNPDTLRQPENPERPLPQRLTPKERRQAFVHPYADDCVKPRAGRVTLNVAQDIIIKFKEDPVANDANTLADAHQLDPELLKNALRHFRIFNTHKNKDSNAQARRLDPLVAQPDWEEAPPAKPAELPSGQPASKR